MGTENNKIQHIIYEILLTFECSGVQVFRELLFKVLTICSTGCSGVPAPRTAKFLGVH